jgi:ornithine--oxo-acid transaminase
VLFFPTQGQGNYPPTGVEAVETAIKLARKWGYRRKDVARDAAEIIVCHNNFHGRTTTVVGFSSERQYRDDFGPYSTGFKAIEFGRIDELEAAITPNTVAFLVEPIQAEAGILMPPDGYLSAARALCRRHGLLFVLDEIQTGLARTGRSFAFEHEPDTEPDLLIVGKALGGGVYPVSAVIGTHEVLGLMQPGDHGSTFGGNPLAAAVAESALAVIVDERLAERAEMLGRRLCLGLEAIGSSHVKEIRGRGLLIGVEIEPESGTARTFSEKLLQRGVLSKDTHKQVLRIAPPLIMTEAEVDWLVDQLAAVLR